MNDMNFMTEDQLSPFQMYFNRLRSAFSGSIFMALAIVFTCLSVLQLISVIFIIETLPLIELASLTVSIVSTGGCWLVWIHARANSDFGRQLGMVRAYSTFELVIAYIVAILFGLGAVLFAAFSKNIEEAFRAAIKTEAELMTPEVMEILQIYEKLGSLFGVIFAIVFAILAAFAVLLIIRQTKLVGMVKSVTFSFATGRVPHLRTGFYTGMTYVIVIFEGIGLLGSLFSGKPLDILIASCTVALRILTLILITQMKSDIKRFEAMEKSNVWF
jgi:hypothetical protein